jgi:hypothetical protein
MSKAKKRPLSVKTEIEEPTLADHLIRILGENQFYVLVSTATIPGLEHVLVDNMERYAQASVAMQRVLDSYRSLTDEQRAHIEALHSEYEGASLVAMRLSYQRLLAQLQESLTIQQPRRRKMFDMVAADAAAFVRVASLGLIKERGAKQLSNGE